MRKAEQEPALWQIAIVALCLSVFIFGTHARLVQYQELPSNVVTLSTAKLGEADHRMEVQAALENAPLIVLAIISYIAYSSRVCCPAFWQPVVPPSLDNSVYWHVRRFFRPPPVL